MSEKRKLATILFADIAGYTALMQKDEEQALRYLNRFKEVLESTTSAHHGQIVQYFGDGCLLAFDSSVQGAECAMAMQKIFMSEPRLPVRIGMHLGDVVFKNDNVFGDGVNVASRVESLGVPGAILLSKPIRDQIKNRPEFQLQSLGHFDFKNVEEEVEVFAISNAGFAIPKREEMEGKLKPAALKKRPKWILPAAVGGGLLLIAGAWYAGGQKITGASPPTFRSLAVFPFNNQSNNPDLDYLSEGIADNLINDLSSSGDIRVISRRSTFPLRDSIHNLSYIIKLLGVDALLVGNLNQESDQIQLDAELIASSDLSQIWRTKLEGHQNSLPNLESQIARAVLTSAGPSNSLAQLEHRPVDPEAYQHYMQGRFLSYGSTEKEIDLAIEHFHKAIEIEPNYAKAYAALANQKSSQARFSNTSRQELLREARLALQSAFSIDPDLPEAHLADANIRFFCDFDWPGAESAYRKALAADPDNASIYSDFSFFLCAMNQYEEAVELAEQAIRYDPISISSMHIIAWAHLYQHPDKSVEEFKQITELHPTWIWGYMKQGMAEILVGDCEAAMKSMQAVEERKGEWGGELLEAYLAVLYLKCGLKDSAEKQRQFVLDKVAQQGVSDPLNIAILHGGFGNMEEMINWTKKCIEEKSVNVALMQLVKDLDFFVENPFQKPAYLTLLQELRFPGA